ncbi:MAG: DsbA family protein [Tannerella sp.]|jgi:protein-disulfide isomerase|nr:DsbA family protein [Tannerella sp.]
MNLKVNYEDHIRGNAGASLELVEYADFQCPYCRQAYNILKEVEKQLGDDLKIVFRNFPLPELHAHAIHAAVAAEAAGAQGKFWEMHDILFENQRKLEDAHLMEYARQIGLDMKQFEEDLEREVFFRKVEFDYKTGTQQGVEGTPTFFINGELFEGNWMDLSFIDYLRSFIE